MALYDEGESLAQKLDQPYLRSTQYSSGVSGATMPARDFYGSAGARQSLGGFKTYDDYLRAFGTGRQPISMGVNPLAKSSRRTGNIWSASPGYGITPSENVGTPYERGEFEQVQEGQRIGSGAALRGAYGNAANMISSAGGKQELMDYYTKLLMNPQEMLNTPEYGFLRDQMEESVRRTSPRLSGRRAIAAQERAGQLASTYRGQTLGERLMGAGEERARNLADVQTAQQAAQFMTRPEDLIYSTYWGTSLPFSSQASGGQSFTYPAEQVKK